MLIKREPERVVGYVRVSTEEQAENRISIDSQIRLIEEDADAKGQTIAAMFVEPGVSGRDETRPEFNRMLAFVEDPANRIVEVKVWSQSRLARSTETIIPTFARLRRAKVRLVSLTQSISDDPTGHLMRVVIAGFDEHFAAEAAKHTRRTMRANAAEGFFNGGRIPFGYPADRRRALRGVRRGTDDRHRQGRPVPLLQAQRAGERRRDALLQPGDVRPAARRYGD